MCKVDRKKERVGLGERVEWEEGKRRDRKGGRDYMIKEVRGLSGVWTLKEGRVKVGGWVVSSDCAFRL